MTLFGHSGNLEGRIAVMVMIQLEMQPHIGAVCFESFRNVPLWGYFLLDHADVAHFHLLKSESVGTNSHLSEL